MSGHAESAPESGGLADLASFLSDTPETEPKDDEEAQAEDSPEESTDEADTEDEASDQLEDSEGEPEDEDEYLGSFQLNRKRDGTIQDYPDSNS